MRKEGWFILAGGVVKTCHRKTEGFQFSLVPPFTSCFFSVWLSFPISKVKVLGKMVLGPKD